MSEPRCLRLAGPLRLSVLLSLGLSAQAVAGPVTFTGDATADFVGPDVQTLVDPSGIDVGIPLAFPLGTISGNDGADTRFSYDPATDTLYVAINTYTIAGDVDNDGNPNATGPILGGLGGVDWPNWSGSESFAVYFDIDQDGQMDVIAGVPAGSNYLGFRVAAWSPFGNIFTPSTSFGSVLLLGSASMLQPRGDCVAFFFATQSRPDCDAVATLRWYWCS